MQAKPSDGAQPQVARRPSVTNTPRKGKWVKKDYPELEGHNIMALIVAVSQLGFAPAGPALPVVSSPKTAAPAALMSAAKDL